MPVVTSTPSWLAKEKRTCSMPNMSSHAKRQDEDWPKLGIDAAVNGQRSKRSRVAAEHRKEPLQPSSIPRARRQRPPQKLRKAILPPSTPCSPCIALPASPCPSTMSEWLEHETQAFAALRRETSEADFTFVRSMQRWEASRSYATSCPSLSPDPSVSEIEVDQDQEQLCDDDGDGDDVHFVLDMGDSEAGSVSELSSSLGFSPTTSVSSASSCISDFGPSPPSPYLQHQDEVEWLADRFGEAKIDP